jgi:hypothetical protein
MGDKKFYEKVIAILKERCIFLETVWAYSFYHFDEQGIKEYIESKKYIKKQFGFNFKTSLLNVDPSDSDLCFFDYYPLVNSRAHRLGSESKSNILNNNFRQTYSKFLISLVEKIEVISEDHLKLAHYLLLQVIL